MNRQDPKWYANLLSQNTGLKFIVMVLFFLVILLMAFVYGLWQKGKETYVFDSRTGITYGTKGQITLDEIELQVLHNSKEFLINFFNSDHLTIEKARYQGYIRLSPALKQEYGKTLGEPEEIKKIITNKTQFQLNFEYGPRIIEMSHPYYRTYSKMNLKVIYPDGRYSEKEIHIKLTLMKRTPTLEIPDGLYITEIYRVKNDDEATINELLKQSK